MCTRPTTKHLTNAEEKMVFSSDLWNGCDMEEEVQTGWPPLGTDDDNTSFEVYSDEDENLKLLWPLPGSDANRAPFGDNDNSFIEMPIDGSADVELNAMNLMWLDSVVSGLDMPFDQLCESFINSQANTVDQEFEEEPPMSSCAPILEVASLGEEGERQVMFEELNDLLRSLSNPDTSKYCLLPVDERIQDPSQSEECETVSLLETTLSSFQDGLSVEQDSDTCETDGTMSEDDEFQVPSRRRNKGRSLNSETISRMSKKSRQLRKKEQNKNAATRYREKRRLEEMERQMLCEKLEKRNDFLRKEVEDKEQEVKVLRKLLIDIFKTP